MTGFGNNFVRIVLVSMSRLSLFVLLLSVAFAVQGAADVLAPPNTSAQASAQQQVERFHAALMHSARLNGDFSTRAQGVSEALDAVFDIDRIARISAGRAWRDLDDEAKSEYVALLQNVVTATYVSRFDADRGQSFEMLSVREVKPQRFVVKTRINRPTGKAVALDYYFRNGRVFNVVADGVSDLSIRRADYASIVKAKGFAGLMTHLRAQVTAARASIDGLDGA